MNETVTEVRNTRLLTLTAGLIGAFFIVALSLLFWGIIRAPAILDRDDNPRQVEAERRIQRGQILDRYGVIFAQSSGPPDNLGRTYPVPEGGHAVGYYSYQYGASGIEEGFDALLRGTSSDLWADFWRRQRHLPPIGTDVTLTLDANWQRTAVEQLNGRTGAILILEKPHCDSDETICTTQIRAMVSQPDYDANEIDTQFERLGDDQDAPLLNRAAQGQYQPGLLLQPLILAAAVEQNLIRPDDPVSDPDRPILVGETLIHCSTPPPTNANWIDVLQHQCPAPMQDLGDQLGTGGLDTIFNDFGLLTDPFLSIRTETTPDEPLKNPVMASIGQDNLSVTPLQIGLALTALLGDGRIYPPQLIHDPLTIVDGQLSIENALINSNNKQLLLASLDEFEGIHEHNVQVLSGPGGSLDSWYVGFVAGETADTIIIAVLEASQNPDDVIDIGREMGTAVKITTLN